MHVSELHTYFAEGGPLSQVLSSYRPRAEQLKLAEAIERCIDHNDTLIAEAGTGIGKTFAYLLPALLSERQVILSTATKALQEQLFNHDLPQIQRVLQREFNIALLKGRSNYLCHYRYESYEPPSLFPENLVQEWQLIQEFYDRTADGDLDGLHGVAEHSPLRLALTSTPENCLGKECPYLEQCFIKTARQKAHEADVCVVNHHLLLADFSLRDQTLGEILPQGEIYIIDEAHRLPTTAIHFFSERLNSSALHTLRDDILLACKENAPDALDVIQAANAFKTQVQHWRLSLPPQTRPTQLSEEDIMAAQPAFIAACQHLHKDMQALAEVMEQHAARSAALGNVQQRLHDCINLCERCLERLQNNSQDSDRVLWLDYSERYCSLHLAPLSPAQQLQSRFKQKDSAWIFLSATLAVDGTFEHFQGEMGIPQAQTLLLGSPFDYRHQGLMYCPADLPEPNHPEYTQQLVRAVLPIFEASRGRAFFLFTSYRAMNQAYEVLKDSPFTVLLQGERSKVELLNCFKNSERALLLATATFWEGVDVRGKALVCVVIDKLPFASPTEPITAAKLRRFEAENQSGFFKYSLPQAVISLKQGVGRLIRDYDDYGVLVIGDPRLLQKSYGKIFLNSLPRMTRTTKLEAIARFFAYHESHHESQKEEASS